MTQRNAGATKIGVLADPEAGSEEAASHLSMGLASELARLLGGQNSDWEVQVDLERLPSGARDDSTSVLDRAEAWRHERGTAVVICISDLPVIAEGEPVVADLSRERGIAVLSIPAFGCMVLRRRVRRMAAVLIADLLRRQERRDGAGEGGVRAGHARGSDRSSTQRRIAIGRHFRWVVPDEEQVDVRVLASRGQLRLLVGMVRDNRPWRLSTGLTGALVAAFAISAFYMVSSVAWQIAATLGAGRLTIVMLASLVLLVLWLILRHGMWERPDLADLPYQRQQIRMFNVSTVLTLSIGVLCLYAMLFVAILAAAVLLIPGQLLADYAGDSGPGSYLLVSWMITSVATLGGALGSGLDSDRAVRAAAYGYRERERSNRWRKQRQGA